MSHDKILISDLNFRVDLSSNVKAAESLGIMDSFNFVQLVSGPTHNRGHTLDLVLYALGDHSLSGRGGDGDLRSYVCQVFHHVSYCS